MIKLLPSFSHLLSLSLFFCPLSFFSSSLCTTNIAESTHRGAITSHDDHWSIHLEDNAFEGFSDSISFDDKDNDPLFNEFFDTVGTNTISRSITPVDIMATLLSVNAIQVLQNEFFLHTNPLVKRNPLDEPIFEPDLANPPGKFVVGLNTWIRKTNRSYFTKDSTKLSSYLSLVESDFVNDLQESLDLLAGLNPDININVVYIFSLFENMTVEERQAGCMWHLMKKWRKTTLRIMTPLYYFERNFSLTKQEQDAVAQEFGEMDPQEEKEFRKAHFISDRIGMGDTRLEVDCKIVKHPDVSFRLGGQATIPTAFTWGKGFAGSSFARPSTLPVFDFAVLFDLAEQNPDQAMQLLGNFFLESFDRLAANLLDTPLGNNKHLGLGIFARGKTSLRTFVDTEWAERINFTNRISLEFFIPSTESRFYINTINQQLFEQRDFEDLSPQVAAANLLFLQEQLVERFFLRAFDTRIHPGLIFRWTSAARYQARLLGVYGGTDFWLQNKESRGKIFAAPATVSQLNLAIAKPPMAWEYKLFGGLVFRHKTYKRTWFFTINGDATFDSKGIGGNYALAFNFEASF